MIGTYRAIKRYIITVSDLRVAWLLFIPPDDELHACMYNLKVTRATMICRAAFEFYWAAQKHGAVDCENLTKNIELRSFSYNPESPRDHALVSWLLKSR